MNNSYLPRVQMENNTSMVQFKNEYDNFMCEQKYSRRLMLERGSFIMLSF